MPKSGYLTPSTFGDLMTSNRSGTGFGKTAQKVIERLALDLIGVERLEMDSPASCQWGLDNEWLAIQEYEERTFRKVICPVKFTVSKTHPYVGGTMDGLVGDNGGIEVKSPYDSINHLLNLREAYQLHNEYWYQVQGYFWIYELSWIDFISFDPRFPKPMDLNITRVERDEDTIEKLKARCEQAYSEAIQLVDVIRRKAC